MIEALGFVERQASGQYRSAATELCSQQQLKCGARRGAVVVPSAVPGAVRSTRPTSRVVRQRTESGKRENH